MSIYIKWDYIHECERLCIRPLSPDGRELLRRMVRDATKERPRFVRHEDGSVSCIRTLIVSGLSKS